MKALTALQSDRKGLMKKLRKLDAQKDAVAQEIEKIDHAIAALGGKVVGAKPVAKKHKITKAGRLRLRLGQFKKHGNMEAAKAMEAEIATLQAATDAKQSAKSAEPKSGSKKN